MRVAAGLYISGKPFERICSIVSSSDHLPIYKDKLNLWYDIAFSNIEDNVYLSLPLLVEVYPRIFSRSLGHISSWHLSFLLSIKSDALRAHGMVLALSKTQKLSYMMAFTVLGGDMAPVLLSWQRSVIYHFLFGMPAYRCPLNQLTQYLVPQSP